MRRLSDPGVYESCLGIPDICRCPAISHEAPVLVPILHSSCSLATKTLLCTGTSCAPRLEFKNLTKWMIVT